MADKKQQIQILVSLGNTQLKQKNFEATIQTFTKAIAMAPRNSSLLCRRALTHLNLNNYQAALRDAKAAQRIDINDMESYERIAQCYMASGDFDVAFEELSHYYNGKTNAPDVPLQRNFTFASQLALYMIQQQNLANKHLNDKTKMTFHVDQFCERVKKCSSYEMYQRFIMKWVCSKNENERNAMFSQFSANEQANSVKFVKQVFVQAPNKFFELANGLLFMHRVNMSMSVPIDLMISYLFCYIFQILRNTGKQL